MYNKPSTLIYIPLQGVNVKNSLKTVLLYRALKVLPSPNLDSKSLNYNFQGKFFSHDIDQIENLSL